MFSKSKISPKENVSRITAVFPLNTVPKFHNEYPINTQKNQQKKTTDRLQTLERPQKKNIIFVDVQKTSTPHWLAHLLPAYGQASVFFHCEWRGSMEATAISWALPPHLGTFHISSLCAGVNDAVVADLQVLGPKLLMCNFCHHHFTSQQKTACEHKIQTKKQGGLCFCKKTNVKWFFSTKKSQYFSNTKPSNRNEFFRVFHHPSKVQLWIKPHWAWGHCLASKWAILPPSEVSSKDVGPGETEKNQGIKCSLI